VTQTDFHFPELDGDTSIDHCLPRPIRVELRQERLTESSSVLTDNCLRVIATGTKVSQYHRPIAPLSRVRDHYRWQP
jgi:hypothetical protein